jgi:urease accessory protein
MGEGDLLKLSQWLSPGFPVSAYAYSHGLETEIAEGRVRDGHDLNDWVAAVLLAGAGRSDATLMLAARHGAQSAEALSDLVCALAGSRERLEETQAQGRALAETLAGLGVGDGQARPYPVALGLAARDLDLPDRMVAALLLQAFAGALVSVAVRFVPLG